MAIFRRPLALLSRTPLGRQIPISRSPVSRSPLGHQIPRFSSAVPASRVKGTTIIGIVERHGILLGYDSRATREFDKGPQIVSDNYEKVMELGRLRIVIFGEVNSAVKLMSLLKRIAFPRHDDPAFQLADFAVFYGPSVGPAKFGLIIAGFDSNNNPSLCVVDYNKVDNQPPVVMKEKVDRLVVRGPTMGVLTSKLREELRRFHTLEELTVLCKLALLDAATCDPGTGGYLTVSYLTCRGFEKLIRTTVVASLTEVLDLHNPMVQSDLVLIHSHLSVAQPDDVKKWLGEMGPGRVKCVGPQLTKLRGQYYMRLVFFENKEGASGTYDEAKEVQKVPIFATKGEGFKQFTVGAEEIWVCRLTEANLEAMVPQIDD